MICMMFGVLERCACYLRFMLTSFGDLGIALNEKQQMVHIFDFIMQNVMNLRWLNLCPSNIYYVYR